MIASLLKRCIRKSLLVFITYVEERFAKLDPKKPPSFTLMRTLNRMLSKDSLEEIILAIDAPVSRVAPSLQRGAAFPAFQARGVPGQVQNFQDESIENRPLASGTTRNGCCE